MTRPRAGRPRARTRRVLLTAGMVLILLVVLFPIYWAVVTSVLPTSIIMRRTPPIIPPLESVSFEIYAELLQREQVWTWLKNTTIVTVGSALLAMVVSTAAGYSMSRIATRGRYAMSVSLLFGRMLPGTLIVIPIFIMFSSVGLTNSLLGLILANTTVIIPFSSWMMKSFFDSVPVELEDAALIDGCSRIGSLVRIILPLSKPGVAATGIFAALVAWGDYLFVRTLVKDPNMFTVTVGLTSFQGEYGTDWNSVMAMGIISMLPIAILFIALEPLLVSGLTAGSVKG